MQSIYIKSSPYVIYISRSAYKKELFWYFDAELDHMAAWSRGYGTNFDWLR